MHLIKEIRQFLKNNKIDYLLVNSTNEFLMEYTPLEENSRYLLTNFSGSTGDALISQKDIFLFVDGRYHEQADAEVDKKLVTVIKMKIGESVNKILEKKLKPNKTIGIVSKKVSQGRLEVLESNLKKKGVRIKLFDTDPIIKGKGKRENGKEYTKIGITIAGLSSEEKIKKITKKLKKDEAILVTNLEEVSYITNLRYFSNNYTCTVRGKYIIDKNEDKFIDKIEIDKNIKTVYVDKLSITAYDYALLGEKAQSLKENYIKEMKSIKSKEEIEHYKECFKKTDMALLATRDYINNMHLPFSEYDIAKNLEENFYKFGAKSLSFKSIVAKDKNSALAHYSKNSKNEIIKASSLILIDCGAYYQGGLATDITRVFVKGEPSKLQKRVYTLVLKAFLKAFNKKITIKTTGFLLDKAARKILNENAPKGFEFSHSLGHGIGISVHESPPNLAFSPLAKTPLKENMCFTIEPGLYSAKHFGVRLENSCYLAKCKGQSAKGEFEIKAFTNMPFEEKLIDFAMLTPTEKKQLKLFKVQ